MSIAFTYTSPLLPPPQTHTHTHKCIHVQHTTASSPTALSQWLVCRLLPLLHQRLVLESRGVLHPATLGGLELEPRPAPLPPLLLLTDLTRNSWDVVATSSVVCCVSAAFHLVVRKEPLCPVCLYVYFIVRK